MAVFGVILFLGLKSSLPLPEQADPMAPKRFSFDIDMLLEAFHLCFFDNKAAFSSLLRATWKIKMKNP